MSIASSNRGGIVELRMHSAGGVALWSRDLLHTLVSALATVAGDDDAEVLILTGTGDRWIGGVEASSFARPMAEWSAAEVYRQFDDGCRLLESLVSLPIPTIAAINGPGPRLEAALLCDLTLCTADTSFGDGNFGAGSVPGDGMHLVLEELVGRKRAAAAVYLGSRVSAEEALRLGMVNEVVPDVRHRAHAIADQILRQPRTSRRLTHDLIAHRWRRVVGELRGRYAQQLLAALTAQPD